MKSSLSGAKYTTTGRGWGKWLGYQPYEFPAQHVTTMNRTPHASPASHVEQTRRALHIDIRYSSTHYLFRRSISLTQRCHRSQTSRWGVGDPTLEREAGIEQFNRLKPSFLQQGNVLFWRERGKLGANRFDRRFRVHLRNPG
jgi:hypothetical protein